MSPNHPLHPLTHRAPSGEHPCAGTLDTAAGGDWSPLRLVQLRLGPTQGPPPPTSPTVLLVPTAGTALARDIRAATGSRSSCVHNPGVQVSAVPERRVSVPGGTKTDRSTKRTELGFPGEAQGAWCTGHPAGVSGQRDGAGLCARSAGVTGMEEERATLLGRPWNYRTPGFGGGP